MNTYHAFYKGKQIELQAETSYTALGKAVKIFKTKKGYDITIVLVALADGKEIVHTAVD